MEIPTTASSASKIQKNLSPKAHSRDQTPWYGDRRHTEPFCPRLTLTTHNIFLPLLQINTICSRTDVKQKITFYYYTEATND